MDEGVQEVQTPSSLHVLLSRKARSPPKLLLSRQSLPIQAQFLWPRGVAGSELSRSIPCSPLWRFCNTESHGFGRGRNHLRREMPDSALPRDADRKHAAAYGCDERACVGGGAACGGGGGLECEVQGEAGGGSEMQIGQGRGATGGVAGHLCFLVSVGFRSKLCDKSGFLCLVRACIWWVNGSLIVLGSSDCTSVSHAALLAIMVRRISNSFQAPMQVW